MSDLLTSFISSERPEQIAHGRSFPLRDLSDSLTVAHLSWAIWANRSQSLIWFERNEQMSKWANERMSDERMSKFPALPFCHTLPKCNTCWVLFTFWRQFIENCCLWSYGFCPLTWQRNSYLSRFVCKIWFENGAVHQPVNQHLHQPVFQHPHNPVNQHLHQPVNHHLQQSVNQHLH